MERELIYIYGKHAVAEAVAHRPDLVREVHIGQTFADDALLAKLATVKVKPRLIGKRLPGGLRNDVAHQGVIAGIDPSGLVRPYKDFMSSVPVTPDVSFLILGEVQDPHNVGAVIRSAAAMGITAVMIPPHNQAPITGTVVKVSAGMAFRIPLIDIRNVNATIRDLKDRGFWIYGLAGDGNSVVGEAFARPTAFVLGNEGSGLREKTREACDEILSIPMHPRAESLNAAASAAIVMYAWSAKHPNALSPQR